MLINRLSPYFLSKSDDIYRSMFMYNNGNPIKTLMILNK